MALSAVQGGGPAVGTMYVANQAFHSLVFDDDRVAATNPTDALQRYAGELLDYGNPSLLESENFENGM